MDPAPTTSPSLAGARGPGPQPYRLRWVVASVVLAANVMDLLDATIVNVAAPSIHRDLGGGASTIQWLSAGYTLAFGRHPATYALQITAWTCPAPLAAALVLVFRLPMQPREEQAHQSDRRQR